MPDKYSILAIETSGSVCGVALNVGGETIAEYSMFKGNKHDKFLAEYVRRILDDNKTTPDKLSAVAISSGPGSFTGLRIGGALAKALCFPGTPLLIAVPALAACAYAARRYAKALNSEKIIAVISSHKNLAYIQEFTTDAVATGEISIVEKSDIIANFKDSYLYCGPGVNDLNITLGYIDTITSAVIADYAEKLYALGEFVNPSEYDPMYVQEFEPKMSTKKL